MKRLWLWKGIDSKVLKSKVLPYSLTFNYSHDYHDDSNYQKDMDKSSNCERS